MSLNIGFINIAENLGVSFETITLLVVVLGGIIFFAKDFRIGCIINFLLSALTFMMFYGLNYYKGYNLNYAPALVVTFMYLIILAFTLYAQSKISNPYGGVI